MPYEPKPLGFYHEVYFDSLGGTGDDPDGALKAAIEGDFGYTDALRVEFTAMGKAQGGGSGWILLLWSLRRGRLVNAWAADHAHNLAAERRWWLWTCTSTATTWTSAPKPEPMWMPSCRTCPGRWPRLHLPM